VYSQACTLTTHPSLNPRAQFPLYAAAGDGVLFRIDFFRTIHAGPANHRSRLDVVPRCFTPKTTPNRLGFLAGYLLLFNCRRTLSFLVCFLLSVLIRRK
jgi:hypothetical protein